MAGNRHCICTFIPNRTLVIFFLLALSLLIRIAMGCDGNIFSLKLNESRIRYLPSSVSLLNRRSISMVIYYARGDKTCSWPKIVE